MFYVDFDHVFVKTEKADAKYSYKLIRILAPWQRNFASEKTKVLKKQLQNQEITILILQLFFYSFWWVLFLNGSQYTRSNDENGSYNHNDVKNFTHLLTAFHRHEAVSLEYLRSIGGGYFPCDDDDDYDGVSCCYRFLSYCSPCDW